LIAFLLLPPVIAVQYRRWDQSRIWNAVSTAKERRDNALVAWRVAYDADANGSSPATESAVQDAERRYYAARQDVEVAMKRLYALYGNSKERLAKAIDACNKALTSSRR
jgi:hypothetical protein